MADLWIFRKIHGIILDIPNALGKPMKYKRFLNLPYYLQQKSYFLFGPRASGKSFLIKSQLPADLPIFNLLRTELFLELSQSPQRLEPMIMAYPRHDWVVIDEVQRIPMLLNEVHRLIEEHDIHFLLTGSSARRFKQKSVNLLAGRARELQLFPLTTTEITDFDLNRYLQYGGLPAIYLSEDPTEDLYAYVDTYLRDEIQAEAFTRNIAAFSRFLQFAAQTSGQILNFTQLASDVGISASSIREYYHILEDTFLGFMLPAYTKTQKRKAASTAKFYFFDIGVRNTLMNVKAVPPQSDLFGQAFEHFIAMELRAYLSYKRIREPLAFWRSKHGDEVDFIIGDQLAIEVKSSDNIKDKHLKGLSRFAEEQLCRRYIIVSQDPIARKWGHLETMHWQEFLKQLWAGKLI